MITYISGLLTQIRDGEEGATAVEYGVMVALIAAVIIAIVLLLGQQLNAAFTKVSDALTAGGVTT